MSNFEFRLGRNCGLAMAGVKTGNLMCCKVEDYLGIYDEINRLAKSLESAGIQIRILKDNGNHMLILVFRTKALEEILLKKEFQKVLRSLGYEKPEDLEYCLKRLASRCYDKNNFPHEIGVFLGYPVEDILGFIESPKDFLYSGMWKVYHNVEEKITLFEKYKKCTNSIVKKMENGFGLTSIFAKNKVC